MTSQWWYDEEAAAAIRDLRAALAEAFDPTVGRFVRWCNRKLERSQATLRERVLRIGPPPTEEEIACYYTGGAGVSQRRFKQLGRRLSRELRGRWVSTHAA